MIEAVLFDNDGVLVDTESLYFEAGRVTLAEIGIELTLEIYQDVSLRRGQSVFDLAAERGFESGVLAELRETVRLLQRLPDSAALIQDRGPGGNLNTEGAIVPGASFSHDQPKAVDTGSHGQAVGRRIWGCLAVLRLAAKPFRKRESTAAVMRPWPPTTVCGITGVKRVPLNPGEL